LSVVQELDIVQDEKAMVSFMIAQSDSTTCTPLAKKNKSQELTSMRSHMSLQVGAFKVILDTAVVGTHKDSLPAVHLLLLTFQRRMMASIGRRG
jgi:hypothetical protein